MSKFTKLLMYGFFTAMLAIVTVNSFDRGPDLAAFEASRKIAQIEPLEEYLKHTESQKFLRSQRHTQTNYGATIKYHDTAGKGIEFRTDNVPYEIIEKAETGKPIYISYVPGQPGSERFQLEAVNTNANRWVALMFLLASLFMFIRTVMRP